MKQPYNKKIQRTDSDGVQHQAWLGWEDDPLRMVEMTEF